MSDSLKHRLWAQKIELDQKHANKKYKTWKVTKQARFEVLEKKSSHMPRTVWVEESKTGLGFEIGSSYDNIPVMSQYLTDG